MERSEKLAGRLRAARMRSPGSLWTAGMVLLAIVFAVVGLSSGDPKPLWTRIGVVLAVLLLIFRQVSRRMNGRVSKAAQPDPESRLKLD